MWPLVDDMVVFFFSSGRRHTRCALVTGVRRVLFRSATVTGTRTRWGRTTTLAAAGVPATTLTTMCRGEPPAPPLSQVGQGRQGQTLPGASRLGSRPRLFGLRRDGGD